MVFGLAKEGKGAGGGGGGMKTKHREEEEEEKVDAGGGGRGKGTLRGCRGYLSAILCLAEHSRTEHDGLTLSDRAKMHSKYINIKSTLYVDLIATQGMPRKLHGNMPIHQIST
jgi:hypothetical protein